MEHIYTGHEKKIHYILAKRVIKSYGIKTNDIAQIRFDCLQPSDKVSLWTVIVSSYKAGCSNISCSENFYTKDCIKHGFYIT